MVNITLYVVEVIVRNYYDILMVLSIDVHAENLACFLIIKHIIFFFSNLINSIYEFLKKIP